MLVSQSRSLSSPRVHGWRALRDWLWILNHRVRRYRVLRTHAAQIQRTGPMAIPAARTRAVTSSHAGSGLVTGVGRRFPIEPERAAQFYRSVDDHE